VIVVRSPQDGFASVPVPLAAASVPTLRGRAR